MSTNYYAVLGKPSTCEHCGHMEKPRELHIGKSSIGWTFALHIEPDDPTHPQTWAEWLDLLNRDGVSIENEYGEPITIEAMTAAVTMRSHFRDREPSTEWLERNSAIPGPNNLARRKIGRFAVAHGAGTWDLCIGHFR